MAKKRKIREFFKEFRTWVVGIAATMVAVGVIIGYLSTQVTFVFEHYIEKSQSIKKINKKINRYHKKGD